MTFISIDQPRVFLACVSIGIISGVIYLPFYLVLQFIKINFVKHIVNGLWLTSCSVIFTYFNLIYEFPNFRAYMVVGVVLGIYLYKLSFHKVFAILLNKVYNVINKLIKKIKAKNERRKEKANILGGFVGVNNVNHNLGGDINLSTRGNIHSKKQNSRT